MGGTKKLMGGDAKLSGGGHYWGGNCQNFRWWGDPTQSPPPSLGETLLFERSTLCFSSYKNHKLKVEL